MKSATILLCGLWFTKYWLYEDQFLYDIVIYTFRYLHIGANL